MIDGLNARVRMGSSRCLGRFGMHTPDPFDRFVLATRAIPDDGSAGRTNRPPYTNVAGARMYDVLAVILW